MTVRTSSGATLRLVAALTLLFLALPLSAQAAGTFTFLGPTGMGGKVRTIVFHPTDPNVAWIGAVGGGVFKTTNGGASWVPVGDGLTNMAVGALAVDPTNPNILYAGTGDRGYQTIGALPGNGIHKSVDGGLTWTHLAATDTAGSDFFEYTSEIAVSPAQPSHLYVATYAGIFRSVDAGTSFTKVFGASFGGEDCRDLAVKPGSSSTDVVLATCGNNTGHQVILRNPDAGGTGSFTVVHNEGSSQGRASFAFAPSSPSTVYALVSQKGGPIQTQVPMLVLLKSTDSGATWSDVVRQDGNAALIKNHLLSDVYLANQSTCVGIPGTSFVIGEGNDKNALAVDPVNANRLYAGGIDFFRSTDGGLTWGIASNNRVGASAGNIRTGHYAIAFPAGYNGTTSQTMWIANDTGLYKTDKAVSAVTTTDPCAAPSSFGFTARNAGLGATMLEDGAVQTGGATYFGASRRFGVVKGTDSGGATAWTSSDLVSVDEVMTDPANPMLLYRRKESSNIQKSVDGGTVWTNASSGISGITGGGGSTVDPSSGSRLWTGAGPQIYRSMDAAASWQAAAASVEGESYINVAVAPSDPNRVVVVMMMDRGAVQILTTTSGLTSNGSTSWARDSLPVSWPLRRHALAIDTVDPQVILLAHDGYGIVRSSDFGATWSPRGNGIIGPAVTAILIDPAVPGRIFAGTEAGLYSTNDAGLHWSLEPGMPRAYISRLKLDGRKLFVFTLGRGAWRAVLDNCSPLAAPASLTATASSTSAVTLSWSAVNGATSYEIHRSSAGAPFTLLKTATATSASDTGLASNTAYVYKVRAVCGAFSALDAATTTLFTNDPLTAGTRIQAVHVTQLRTAIDAMRAAAALQPAAYTHSIAAGSVIRRSDVTEMRTALDAARAAIGLPAQSYRDATITSGVTKVHAAHVEDLRGGVK